MGKETITCANCGCDPMKAFSYREAALPPVKVPIDRKPIIGMSAVRTALKFIVGFMCVCAGVCAIWLGGYIVLVVGGIILLNVLNLHTVNGIDIGAFEKFTTGAIFGVVSWFVIALAYSLGDGILERGKKRTRTTTGGPR